MTTAHLKHRPTSHTHRGPRGAVSLSFSPVLICGSCINPRHLLGLMDVNGEVIRLPRLRDNCGYASGHRCRCVCCCPHSARKEMLACGLTCFQSQGQIPKFTVQNGNRVNKAPQVGHIQRLYSYTHTRTCTHKSNLLLQ